MLNPYKSACEKIAVPPETIDKTAKRLAQARLDANNPDAARLARYTRYRRIAAAFIAAILALPVLISVFMTDSGPIVTKLEDGAHAELVELRDGRLSFQQDTGDSLVNQHPILTGPGVRREEWDAERYIEYLGADAKPGYLPAGMLQREESIVVYVSANGSIVSDCRTTSYASGGGGSVQISVSKGRLPPQCNRDCEENSRIKDVPLAVGVARSASAYWAQFVLDGIGYYIETEGISQKEFVKILYRFFV